MTSTASRQTRSPPHGAFLFLFVLFALFVGGTPAPVIGQSGGLTPPNPAAMPQGSIVGWGRHVVGGDLSEGFVQVAAEGYRSLGVKADGSIAAWGHDGYEQTNVPVPNSGFAPESIYTTLENRMKCGLGKCGRCNVGEILVCKDGPVFTLAQLRNLPPEY